MPNGATVHAHPNPDSHGQARRLGYGTDVAAMTRHHDPLHSELCCWLGMPHSFSLMQASGHPVNSELARLEEDAVMAVQALCVAWDKAKLAGSST